MSFHWEAGLGDRAKKYQSWKKKKKLFLMTIYTETQLTICFSWSQNPFDLVFNDFIIANTNKEGVPNFSMLVYML